MEIINNKKQFCFETILPDNDRAILEYRWLKGRMVLMHTFVPTSGRGMGIGDALVKYALEYARNHGLKIVIYCPFADKYFKAHPEYGDLI